LAARDASLSAYTISLDRTRTVLRRVASGLWWRGGLRTVRARLLLLAALLALPLGLAMAGLLGWSYLRERHAAEHQLMATARALSLAVDRQLGEAKAFVTALAAADTINADDLTAFEAQARRAVAGMDGWLVVTRADGQQVINTRAVSGTALPVDGGFAELWRVLPPSGTLVSDLTVGPELRQPVVSITTRLAVGGRAEFGLSFVMQPEALSRVVADQRLPEGWVGTVLDGTGAVVGRSARLERYLGRRGKGELAGAIKRGPVGAMPAVSFDQVPVIAAWNRSPVSGWSTLVLVPRGQLAATARRSTEIGVLLGLAALGCSALLSRWVARSITLPVRALARSAEALGRGDPVPRLSTGLLMADEVGRVMEEASVALREREARYRDLAVTLEERVASRTAELAAANAKLVVEIEERQRAERELARAQRLEAVGQLTGGIAHDFNNLLMVVIGSLEMLERTIADGPARTIVARAMAAAERGAKLTTQLLAFARQQRLELRSLNVNQVIAGMIELMQRTLGVTIRVETALAADISPAVADPTQLELVILNLAINARDAMPLGGTLRIETSNINCGDPEKPEHPARGAYVAVAVKDSGSGMEPEVMARAFEPFFTTKEVGKGSGLGLSQVLGVAKQVGGGVAIESWPGSGTTVWVYLPRAIEAVATSSPAAPAAGVPVLVGLRVLLVDDDVEVRAVARELLVEHGAAVTEAGSGSAALECLHEIGWFDVALLDLAMPGLSGEEVAVKLRQRRPDMPILLMTGYNEQAELARGINARAPVDGVLQKPFRAKELTDAIARIVSARDAAAGFRFRRSRARGAEART
jgi:signal transduction histidine kinase/ActR/RegA family two-component response regulator